MPGGKRKTAINTKNSQILSTIHGVRPEVELLLAAAGNYDEDHRRALIEDILKDEIDWDYFKQLTNHHRIWPLVYWNLNLADSKAISKQFLDHLKDQFNQTALRNLFLSQKLLELLELLKSNHIDAIPYKGSFLASEYYGNLALRQFGDIDILVKQKDILNVRAILIDSGFIPLDKLDKKNEKIFLKHNYDFHFNSSDGKFHVEIHWQLIYRPLQPAIEYIWESCINTKFFGTEVLTLPPEEWLVILCLHGYKHYWQRLKWLCDIALIIKSNPNLNWNHIKWRANNLGTEKSLYLGLYVAHFLLNAKLPNDIVQIIRSQ